MSFEENLIIKYFNQQDAIPLFEVGIDIVIICYSNTCVLVFTIFFFKSCNLLFNYFIQNTYFCFKSYNVLFTLELFAYRIVFFFFLIRKYSSYHLVILSPHELTPKKSAVFCMLSTN